MSEPVYFTTLGLFLGTILLVFGMRYFAAVAQAKARLDSDRPYRELAEAAASNQSATITTLARIEQALGELSPRVAEVEKILKDVA